jgi:hypothetical protein
LSEASKLAWASGCATGLRTRSRHACDRHSASRPLRRVGHRGFAVRWPGATGLTSYLSSCLSLTSQRCLSGASPAFRTVFTSHAATPCPPQAGTSLCLAFQRLSSGGHHAKRPPECSVSCWRTVAALHPLGDCDSLRPETSLSYLTRFGTVSNRPLPLSPSLASLTARERRQRNW